tara:strand:+ start:55 stop:1245 length:1191 start_codon:yes stop_codon:yes gene_type:complete
MDKNQKVKITDTPSKVDEDTNSKLVEKDDSSEKKPPRWFGRILISSLLVALAYVFWPLWEAGAPGWLHKTLAPVMEAGRTTGVAVRMDDLTKRLKVIENKLEIVKSKLKKLYAHRPDFQSLEEHKTIKIFSDVQDSHSSRLKTLDINLNNLERKLEAIKVLPESSNSLATLKKSKTNDGQELVNSRKVNEALNNAIKDLEKRLDKLEFLPKFRPGFDRRGALLLAVGQLKDSVATSNEFTGPLKAAQAISSGVINNTEAFLTLIKFAESGVKNLAVLRQNFQEVSNDIVRASYTPAGDGWVDQTLFKISQLVTFRRTGPEGALRNDVAGKVARAEMRLAARDLKGAIAIIKGLPGDAAKISQKWLADAEARAAVDIAVADLFSKAIKAGPLGASDK